MALEYTLYLKTDLNPKEFVELVFKSMEFSYKIEESDESDRAVFITESGFSIYAKYASQFQRLLIKEDLDITEPSIHILLRLNKFQDRVIVKKSLVSFIRNVLEKNGNDCVFLYNHEEVLLMRKLGEININKNSKFWNDEYLELLKEPYKIICIDNL